MISFPKVFIRLAVIFCFNFFSVARAKTPDCCKDFVDSKGVAAQKLLYLQDVFITNEPPFCRSQKPQSIQNIYDSFVKILGDKPVERWEVKLPDELKDRVESIVSVCENNFGMRKKILPKKNIKYFGVLIFGARLKSVVNRVIFYNKLVEDGLIDKDLKLWVLAGKRKLVDYEIRNFDKIVGQKPLAALEGEFGMMKAVIDALVPKDRKVEYISGECAKDRNRATTYTQVMAWIKKIPKSTGAYYLGISNQPHARYQESVMYLVLKDFKREDIKIYMIGSEAKLELRSDRPGYARLLLDTIRKTIWNCNKLIARDVKI